MSRPEGSKSGKNPVARYLLVMFAAVMAIILLSYLAQNRNEGLAAPEAEGTALTEEYTEAED